MSNFNTHVDSNTVVSSPVTNEKKDNIILYNYVILIFILFLYFVISVVNLKNVLIKQNQ